MKTLLTKDVRKNVVLSLILTMVFVRVIGQDSIPYFAVINWGSAASQQYPVSEAQGKVVNGRLYSFGGFDSQKSTFTPTKRSFVYNPETNVWSSIADLPYTPTGISYGGVTHAGITSDGTDIYIAGGYTSNSRGTGQIFGTKQVWKYIIAQNVYTRLPDLPIDVAAGQLEYLNGKLHYIGGTNSSRNLDLGNHYVLDLNNQEARWDTLAPLPNPRHHAGSAVYDGKIYFIGGQHGHDANLVAQKDVHAYDQALNKWTKLADLPVPSGANGRGHISSAIVVIGDRILVLGGEIAHQSSVNIVSAYSPATDSWENLTSLPQNRFSGVAGVINSVIYYTGGSASNTTFKGIPEGVILSSAEPTTTSTEYATLSVKKPLVFPNPLDKHFKIRFPGTYKGYFTFTIVDRSGTTYLLGSKRIQARSADIGFDISKFSLSPGIYYLKLESETKKDLIKVVLK